MPARPTDASAQRRIPPASRSSNKHTKAVAFSNQLRLPALQLLPHFPFGRPAHLMHLCSLPKIVNNFSLRIRSHSAWSEFPSLVRS